MDLPDQQAPIPTEFASSRFKKLIGFGVAVLLLIGVLYWILGGNDRFSLDLSRNEAASGTVTLRLEPASVTVAPGDPFAMNVVLDAGTNLVSVIDLRVSFPSGTVRAESITMGPALPNGIVLVPGTVTGTSATITLGSGLSPDGSEATPITGNNLVIATIAMIAGEADGSAVINIDEASVVLATNNDAGNVDILGPRVSATVTIETLAPTVQISANPITIKKGFLIPPQYATSSTLTWSSTNATSLSIDQGIGPVTIPSGTRSVTPSSTTTYTITATNSGGSRTATVTVTVEKMADISGPNGTPDFAVNVYDYGKMFNDFGKTGQYVGDLDGDGRVFIYDYNIMITNFYK